MALCSILIINVHAIQFLRSDLIPGSQTNSEPKIEIQSVIIHK
jgi:hypothetical protein